jgi:hypothetical protein
MTCPRTAATRRRSSLPYLRFRFVYGPLLPTSSVLNGMREIGWVPVRAQEQSIRTEARRGFQKHVVRFARVEHLETWEKNEFLAKVRELYSDSERTDHTLFSDGDCTISEWTFTATQDEPLLDGLFRKVNISARGVSVVQVRDGRIVKWRSITIKSCRDATVLWARLPIGAKYKGRAMKPENELASAGTPGSDFPAPDFDERVRLNQLKLSADLRERYDFIVCGSGSSGFRGSSQVSGKPGGQCPAA